MVWNGAAFTAIKGGGVSSIERVRADLGAGVDTLRCDGSSAAVGVNLTIGEATGFLSVASIENAFRAGFCMAQSSCVPRVVARTFAREGPAMYAPMVGIGAARG